MRYTLILLFAFYCLAPASGHAQQSEAVKAEHRSCKQDADCKLVEVPCTCGQTKLAVNVEHVSKYERPANCTKAQISHCAQVGASLPQAAVCKAGQCASVIKTP